MTFSEAVELIWASPGSSYGNAVRVQRETGFDKWKLLDPNPLLTEREQFRFALVWQTPKSVWIEYAASGYTIPEAIESELSYCQ